MLIRPMLATPGRLPHGAGWASEFKWDGVRTILYVEPGRVRAMSRNDLDVSSQYPEIGELAKLLGDRRAVLDGEIVALDGTGVPDFARLQNRMHIRTPAQTLLRSTPVQLYLFDLMVLDGTSLTGRPYAYRRARLDELRLDHDPVHTPPSFAEDRPADVYQAAVDSRLEGVICKRIGSTYQAGRRSPDWIKVPVTRTQEVLIIGWQPGAGRRAGMIGSLLLGAHDERGRLAYLGKVGTGFTDAALRGLADRLRPLGRDTPTVADIPRPDARGAVWVRPELVGEVEFRAWTPDRRLRHPSWRGLRPDKDPEEVRREAPR